MAFRKPRQQPQFADLIGILAQTKQAENPLYQTIQQIINRLTQFQQVTLGEILDLSNSINESLTIINNTMANKDATYITTGDETLDLPNSVQLLAGPGISFDDSIPNERTISSSTGANHYDSPLSDGDTDEADLIYANGECIIVQVPV